MIDFLHIFCIILLTKGDVYMSYWVYYNTCYSSHKTDIASFYKDLNGTSFKGITADKLDVLKESSLELSKFYHKRIQKANKEVI